MERRPLSKMEKEAQHAAAAAASKSKQQRFIGVRMRKWGKWVSEIRMPHSGEKIWLGSYPSAEQAARAYDVAAYCIRGPHYPSFNFPSLIPPSPPAFPFLHSSPSPSPSPSPSQIRDAASSAAASFSPPSYPSPSPPSTCTPPLTVNPHSPTHSAQLPTLVSSSSVVDYEWEPLLAQSTDEEQLLPLDRLSSLDFFMGGDCTWPPLDEDEGDDTDLGSLWNL